MVSETETKASTKEIPMNALFPGTKFTFEQVRKLCQADLALFSQLFFPHHISAEVGVPPFHVEMHKVMADYSKKYLLIIAPRGFAKTTRALFIETLHDIAYNLEKFIILTSKTTHMARIYLQKIKYELEANALFRATYGNLVTDMKWTQDEILLANGMMIMALGAGKQIRGIIHGPSRPTKILVDDPEDVESVDSEEERERIRDWFDRDVCFSLAQPIGAQRGGRVIVIGTVIHSDCLVANLQKDHRFHTLFYQAIVKQGGEEQSLWPEMFPLEELLAEKEGYERRGRLHHWMMERMNIPLAADERLARESDLREWDGSYTYANGLSTIQWGEFLIPVEVTTAVDVATREKRTSDFTVILTVGVDANRNVYLLEYWRFRESDPIRRFVALMLQIGKYHPTQLVIETVSSQQDFSRMFQYLRENKAILKGMLEEQQIREEDIRNVMNSYIPVVHEIPRQPQLKVRRILSNLQPLFRMHMIHHRPFMQEFVREALRYPETGHDVHDDIVDALEMACSFAHGAFVGMVQKRREVVPRDAYRMRDGSRIRYTTRLPLTESDLRTRNWTR